MYYTFSDVHGRLDLFEQAINNWNKQDLFVFLGDAIDRGPNSIEILLRLKELSETYPDKVICLFGNHDHEFLRWLKEPKRAVEYYWEYLAATLHNVIDRHPQISDYGLVEINEFINREYDELLQFIKSWKFHFETEALIFVHAGYNHNFDDWKQTSDDDLLWARSLVEAYAKNQTKTLIEKRTVVGHTPTSLIREDQLNDVFVSFDGKLIAIDGGCVFGGQLNTVRFNEHGDIVEIKSFS